MVEGDEEIVARSLKRPYPANGKSEAAEEDAGRRLERAAGGGHEDASEEESLSKLQKEVTELAKKVAEYREKGPVAFASLLESSLAQMRSSAVMMETQVSNMPTKEAAEGEGMAEEVVSSDKETQAQRTKLLETLASAKEALPTILRDMNSCKQRLDKAMTARRLKLAADLPLHPAPDKGITELFTVPDN